MYLNFSKTARRDIPQSLANHRRGVIIRRGLILLQTDGNARLYHSVNYVGFCVNYVMPFEIVRVLVYNIYSYKYIKFCERGLIAYV